MKKEIKDPRAFLGIWYHAIGHAEFTGKGFYVYVITEDGALQKVRVVASSEKEFIYENNGFDCSGTDYCGPIPFTDYKKTFWLKEDRSE